MATAVPPLLKLIDSLQAEAVRNPNDRLEALISEPEELAPSSSDAAYLGFAVPLRRRSDTGELHLLTTLTYFGTAVTVTERRLGAFLPVDGATASILGELERL